MNYFLEKGKIDKFNLKGKRVSFYKTKIDFNPEKLSLLIGRILAPDKNGGIYYIDPVTTKIQHLNKDLILLKEKTIFKRNKKIMETTYRKKSDHLLTLPLKNWPRKSKNSRKSPMLLTMMKIII